MVAQAAVALVLLVFLFASFNVFIDFATTAGFVTAPVIAWLNHRVMMSERIPAPARPPAWLRLWSGIGAAAFLIASLVYLYCRFV